MTAQAKLFAGGIIVAVLVVFGFCVKRDMDTKNGARIAIDDSVRKVQAVAQVVAQKKTDSASHALDTLSRVVQHVDTAWVIRKVAVNTTVERIVHDVTPDSTKVRQLVVQIGVLEVVGDSLKEANRALFRGDSSFRVAVAGERLAAAATLQTATGEIGLLKHLSRHWGLGGGIGYGATRDGQGIIRAGPTLTVGLVYRF